jgi:hypothetical protein
MMSLRLKYQIVLQRRTERIKLKAEEEEEEEDKEKKMV